MPVYVLSEKSVFFPDAALAEPDGLLAIGGDLTPLRLLEAYRRGVFPWYSDNSPILWWSPDPRCILLPAKFHVPRSLNKLLKKSLFRCSFDESFLRVIDGCSMNRKDGTWIVPEIKEAYHRLHCLGFAHSVETWKGENLVGGLYGVSLGSVFFGESMFFTEPNASKAALVFLVEQLLHQGISFIDCQQETANLLRFGAQAIARNDFLELLQKALESPTLQGKWTDEIYR